jgi:hypothetical protein
MSVAERRMAPVVMPACARVRLSAMAAPSNGVPSWKVTPSRAVIVQTVKSSFGVTDSARYGLQEPSSLGSTRLS